MTPTSKNDKIPLYINEKETDMRKNRMLDLTLVAMFCALFALSAMLTIPSVIPITLQTLVLFLSFFILGGRRTLAVTLLYIAVGALGAPVFSGFSGGVFRLVDATGGFIFGFATASLVYWLVTALGGTGVPTKIVGALLALLSLYTTGVLWYVFVYLGSIDTLGASLTVTVLPFVIPDLIKLYVAYLIAKRIPKL